MPNAEWDMQGYFPHATLYSPYIFKAGGKADMLNWQPPHI
jgi:hypothetical protein